MQRNSLLGVTRVAVISALLVVSATALISTATASSKTPAAGAIGVTERTVVMTYRAGDDIVRELLVRRTLTGTFSGSEVSVVHNVTHPDGSSDLKVLSSCTCTVEGRTGTVTFRERAAVDAAGIITVHRKVIDAAGDLAGLRAQLDVAAPIAAPTQPYTGSYQFGDGE